MEWTISDREGCPLMEKAVHVEGRPRWRRPSTMEKAVHNGEGRLLMKRLSADGEMPMERAVY